MAKEIPLTQGQVAIVDDEDYEWLMQWKWYAIYRKNAKLFYAGRTEKGHKSILLMHRALLKPEPTELVDHVNRNGIDNRRSNLRVCTRSQNAANMKRKSGSSEYKGVFRTRGRGKPGRKWAAQICVNYKIFNLGRFDTPEEAKAAYDKAALELFGEFARTS